MGWRAVLPHRRGCRWGVTGMLLAVPITAVLRIHLSHIYHPLPRWIAALLVGAPHPHNSTEHIKPTATSLGV